MVSPSPHILPPCRVKATFIQCPVQETIKGVGWGAEAKNWGEEEAVAPSHRRSSRREIIPAHSRFLGYGTSKMYPLPHFTLDVRQYAINLHWAPSWALPSGTTQGEHSLLSILAPQP